MSYEYDAYLRKVRECAVQALVQSKMVRRCDKHVETLIITSVGGPAHVAENLATLWMKSEGGHRGTWEDVREAVATALSQANVECPECAGKGTA